MAFKLGIDLQPADGQRANLDMEHINSAQISLVRSVMTTLICKGGWIHGLAGTQEDEDEGWVLNLLSYRCKYS